MFWGHQPAAGGGVGRGCLSQDVIANYVMFAG